jgi:FtsP/CotA-like multicopper oxidase with cupredoxin domain
MPKMPAADPHAVHRQTAAKMPAAEDPHAGHQQAGAAATAMEDHSAHQGQMAGGHAGHSMPGMEADSGMGGMQSHDHPNGPGNSMVAMQPTNRLDEPGTGLENVPHRALRYSQLRSLEPNPDLRPPGREIELHLTSNMERYMWSFDGKKYSDVVDPIVFYKDERVRLTLVNDTMMAHPIHLHGMFFDVVTGAGDHKPRKHTIIVKPGENMSVDITADNVGDWAFHCHLLYHMHAGMFRVVSVLDTKPEVRS